MPLVTRAVFGFVYRTDGTPLAAVPITIRAYPNVFQPDGSVAPASLLTPITNSVGRYDVVLVVNARYLIGIPGDVFEIIVPSGAGSVSVESLRATTGVLMTNALQLLFNTKENALGNPDTDGKILSSTVAGARLWIAPPSGGGGGSFTVGAWQALNLEGGWINYDSIFPAYRKITINGVDTYVELRGEIYKVTPTEGETIATLAVGYRLPLAWTRQQFPVYNQIGATAGRIIIRSTGLIQYYTGGSQLDLSAVRFYLV